jgi:hypothetical protein
VDGLDLIDSTLGLEIAGNQFVGGLSGKHRGERGGEE